MRLLATSRLALSFAALTFAANCSSGGSALPDGGPPRDGGSARDGGPTDGGRPLGDAGVPCNQQPIGTQTCGVAGGLECPRGQVCVVNSCMASPTTRPGPRSDHGLLFDPVRNRVLLFGGDTRGTVNEVEQPSYVSETWSFDLATQRWERLSPLASPEARGGFASARAGRRWILFGGRSGSFGTLRLHNDVWSFDLVTDQWSQLSPDIPKAVNPNVPDPRHRGRAAFDAATNRLLVFGGSSDPERFGNRVHNDMWSFDLDRRTWQVVPPTSPWPSPRQSFAADVDESSGRWFIFGGARDGQNFLDEVWQFTFSTGSWVFFNTTGAPPTPEFARHASELVYAPVEDRLYVFGGHDGTAMGRRNDLWRFELQTRAWMAVSAGDTEPRQPNCRAPERREEHALVYLQAQRRLMVFGGESGCGLLDDLWYYNLDGASWSNPYVASRGESCERVATACFGPCP